MEEYQSIIRLIFALLFSLLFPVLTSKLKSRGFLPPWLHPIILCYGFGLLLSLVLYDETNKGAIEGLMSLSILLAISLHLLHSKLKNLRSYGRNLSLAYFLCIISAGIAAIILAIVFKDKIEDSAALGGMVSGLYSGGNLNLIAVGNSIGASEELILASMYSDILSGTFLILFLISLGPWFYGLFLSKRQGDQAKDTSAKKDTTKGEKSLKNTLKGLGWALLILLVSVSPFLHPSLSESNKTLAVFVLISLLSLLMAQSKHIHENMATDKSGDYFLLVFCSCLALNVDIKDLFDIAKALLPFFIFLILIVTFIHLVLCRLFKIPRDEAMVAYVAALYGPPFIGQITATIKRQELMSGGIGLAVLGMAIGNIYGIMIALFIQFAIQLL